MGRRKKTALKVEELLPQKFSIDSHLDIAEEAENFEVPEVRARKIAKDVESKAPALLVTLKQNESELRDRFEAAYLEEILRRQECGWDDCQHRHTTLIGAIAHLRWHMVNQDFDVKTARAVLLDIEHQQYPLIEKTLEAALGPEERARVLERIEAQKKKQLEAINVDS
jgi:hypothetical protein